MTPSVAFPAVSAALLGALPKLDTASLGAMAACGLVVAAVFLVVALAIVELVRRPGMTMQL
jgi:hypothetical protein